MVNYEAGSGREVARRADGWGSTLLVRAAGPGDGGNFTCAPASLAPATAMVTIVDSEGKSAAVHDTSSSSSPHTSTPLLLLGLTLIPLSYYESLIVMAKRSSELEL